MHLFRIFLTGAFRKPRDLNAWIGTTMLALAVFEGYAGYSLPDDLLSGMGLAIGYSVALSVPVVGAWLATAIWGGAFPGSDAFIGRLYIVHVLIIPVVIGALITMHLAIIVRQKHAQFRGPGRTERNVVGSPALARVCPALGRATARGDGRAVPARRADPDQPDLAVGAVRAVPRDERRAAGLVPGLAARGAAADARVGAAHRLATRCSRTRSSAACSSRWRRSRCSTCGRRSNGVVTGDDRRHDLLDAPSDAPRRTAAICAATAVVGVVFLAGSADRIAVAVHISYVTQIWILRVAVFVLPVAVYYLVRGICFELQERGRVTPVEPGS